LLAFFLCPAGLEINIPSPRVCRSPTS
jgi:hypothetical protein